MILWLVGWFFWSWANAACSLQAAGSVAASSRMVALTSDGWLCVSGAIGMTQPGVPQYLASLVSLAGHRTVVSGFPKQQRESTPTCQCFSAPADITFADVPLTQATHLGKARFQV